MRRSSFIALIIAGHVLFIFLTIYQQTWITRLLYKQQELERTKTLLTTQKATLEQTLYTLKNPQTISQYAITQLHMQPISLRNVYQLDAIKNHEQR